MQFVLFRLQVIIVINRDDCTGIIRPVFRFQRQVHNPGILADQPTLHQLSDGKPDRIGVLLLTAKEHDVLVMTDLMMGGPGQNVGGEVGELQKSAVSEAMNQMMGTAATSLSTMLNIPTDISTPSVETIDVESVKIFEKMFDNPSDLFVKISFDMHIDNLIDSVMVQLYPLHFALEMYRLFEEKLKNS